jgi:hypothetical protein
MPSKDKKTKQHPTPTKTEKEKNNVTKDEIKNNLIVEKQRILSNLNCMRSVAQSSNILHYYACNTIRTAVLCRKWIRV